MKLVKGNLPLFLQLFLRIKDEIISNELPAGTKLPTIIEMHQQYGVSQATVNKALDLLERDGLIDRKSGLGIFVRNVKEAGIGRFFSSDDQIQSFLEESYFEPISDGWVDIPNRIRLIFEGQEDAIREGKIYHVQHVRINKENESNRALASIHLPAWVADNSSIDQIHEIGVFTAMRYLFRDQQFRAVRGRQTIRPWICTRDVEKYLGLAEGTPILRRSWTYYNRDGRITLHTDNLTTSPVLVRDVKFDSDDDQG